LEVNCTIHTVHLCFLFVCFLQNSTRGSPWLFDLIFHGMTPGKVEDENPWSKNALATLSFLDWASSPLLRPGTACRKHRPSPHGLRGFTSLEIYKKSIQPYFVLQNGLCTCMSRSSCAWLNYLPLVDRVCSS
jgi:hypothetical protein